MSLAPTVPIGDLNKAELLVALYTNAKSFNDQANVNMTRGQAETLLKQQQVFQKLGGCHIWVDLRRDDKVNLLYYNRYNGLNAGQMVIRGLRAKKRLQPGAQVVEEVNSRRRSQGRGNHSRNVERNFIPNASTPRGKHMNVITSAKPKKVVDTSKIYNPATQKQNPITPKKKVQVLNPPTNRGQAGPSVRREIRGQIQALNTKIPEVVTKKEVKAEQTPQSSKATSTSRSVPKKTPEPSKTPEESLEAIEIFDAKDGQAPAFIKKNVFTRYPGKKKREPGVSLRPVADKSAISNKSGK